MKDNKDNLNFPGLSYYDSSIKEWIKLLIKPFYADNAYIESIKPVLTAESNKLLVNADTKIIGNTELVGTFKQGLDTEATGDYSHAEGKLTTASGLYSHAEGYSTTAEGYTSHAEGHNNTASGRGSHAEGINSSSLGNYSHAEGHTNTASEVGSHAEGYNSTASGSASHAEGSYTIASNDLSHAEGYYTTASGYYSHAEGDHAKAYGNTSHAEGKNTYACNAYSHAEGEGSKTKSSFTVTGAANTTTYTTSSNHGLKVGQVVMYNDVYRKIKSISSTTSFTVDGTLSLGALNRVYINLVYGVAYGEVSHAEGESTTASGMSSHAEGRYTTASGSNSHAEGSVTIAAGQSSHVEGYNTQTNNNGEHAEGEYNISIQDKTIHTVGIGNMKGRKNAHEIHTDGKHYILGIGGYDGTNSQTDGIKTLQEVINSKQDKLTIEISWSDLKSKRDNGELIPGMQYRITDYVTTTIQADTQSAGHPFDVIVTALDTNKLSEIASAIQSTRDTDGYFSNSNLVAWQLWYCLDNDINRFSWADSTNGKGVIYRMIDEYDNDCPYDFKNIQFKRYKVTGVTSTKLTSDALNNLKSILVKDSNGGLYFATKDSYGNFVPSNTKGVSFEIDENDSNWYYTFQGISSADGSTINKMYDLTVETFKLTDECISYLEGDGSGADIEDYCRENKIEQFNQEYFADDIYYKGRQILNNIVFIGGLNYCYYNEEDFYWEYNTSSIYGNRFGVNCNSNTFRNYCRYNTFGNYCYGNTFGNKCYGNTFGNYCYSNIFGNEFFNNISGNNYNGNIFGNYCYGNTFGSYCRYSTFGNYFQYNTFGNYCDRNTFGNYFQYNTFGNDCQYNTFGNDCQYNTFGNDCYYNIFGNSCGSNTFGNYCDHNTFGNDCQYNTFGNDCNSNIFGNNCYYNTFGNSCSYINVQKDYVYYIIVENGNQNINITSSQTTSSSEPLRNFTISQGVNNTTTTKTISHNTVGDTFKTTYQPANSSVVSI